MNSLRPQASARRNGDGKLADWALLDCSELKFLLIKQPKSPEHAFNYNLKQRKKLIRTIEKPQPLASP